MNSITIVRVFQKKEKKDMYCFAYVGGNVMDEWNGKFPN